MPPDGFVRRRGEALFRSWTSIRYACVLIRAESSFDLFTSLGRRTEQNRVARCA